MRTSLMAAIFAALLSPLAAASVWFTDQTGLYRLDPAGARIVATFTSGKARAIAVDPRDDSVWVLHEDRLVKRRASGVVAFERNLKALGMESASIVAIDGRDGSIWIGDGKGNSSTQRVFLHLDENGLELAEVPAPSDSVGAAVSLDQSLWILGKKRLLHYTAQGSSLADIDLERLTVGEPKLLQVDAVGAWIWFAAERRLARLDAASPASSVMTLGLVHSPDAMAVDSITGSIWVLADKRLFRHGGDGTTSSIDLEASGVKEARTLAFDARTRSLFAGGHEGIARIPAVTGGTPLVIPHSREIQRLEAPPLVLDTVLSLEAPAAGSLINRSMPTLGLKMRAMCSGADCGFAGEFFTGYSLSVSLNGEQVGDRFALQPGAGVATYQPAAALPEGVNVISARARDPFGKVTPEVSGSFTVDTIAPQFVDLSPPHGGTTATAQVIIRGNVSEPGTITIRGDVVALAADGSSFAFPVALKPGRNTWQLGATDRAGNATTQEYAITLSSLLQVTVTSPVEGASITGTSVAVTGTFEGPANSGITVNGIVATILANRFSALVPLVPGGNELLVQGRSLDGSVTSRVIRVVRSSVAAPEARLDPTSGISPHTVKVTTPTLEGRDSVQLRVDFDGDGAVDATLFGFGQTAQFTYRQPGIYTAQVFINDFAGGNYQQSIPVVVQDVREVDQRLRSIIAGMLADLKAGNVDGALSYFSPSSADRYRAMFESIGARLPAAVDGLGTIVDGGIMGEIAEYVLVRDKPGGRQAYFIYLIQGRDGVWRISEM